MKYQASVIPDFDFPRFLGFLYLRKFTFFVMVLFGTSYAMKIWLKSMFAYLLLLVFGLTGMYFII